MAYIVLTFLGLLALILVRKSWPQKTQFIFVGLVIIVGILVYALVDLLIAVPNDVIEKGMGEIFANIPWLDIALYFVMLLGMASKYLFDIIGDRPKKKLAFNKWQFIKPFLVSPIIFATVYGLVPENTPTLMILVFAYQNGFFWQTLLYKAVPVDA